MQVQWSGTDERARRGERGQGMVEYALVIVLVAALTIGITWLLGSSVRTAFSRLFATGAPAEAGEVVETAGPDEVEPTSQPDSGGGNVFTAIADLFDGTSVLDWETGKGNWKVSDGQLVSSGQGSYAVTGVPSSDYIYTVDVVTTKVNSKKPDPDQVTQVVFRFQDENNYYALIPKLNGELELAKKQNGVVYNGLALANAGIDPQQTHQYQVSVEGNQIEVAVDGNLVIRYNDPNPIPDGGVGALNNGSAGAIDNVTVEPNP